MKIAFVHLMKTAGTTVNEHLCSKVLWKRNYHIDNSWRFRDSDWNPSELDWINHAYPQGSRVYVHNHGAGWPDSVLRQFVANDWFTFAFSRHPGDQWCSFYHWSREQGDSFASISHDFDLNDFLQLVWGDRPSDKALAFGVDDLHRNLDLPECWQDMGYVGLFNNKSYRAFLSDYFNIRSWLIRPTNPSRNRGYEVYRKNGKISDATHQLLLNSKRWQDYQSLLEAPATQSTFSSKTHNPFFDQAESNVPVRYVLLESSGSPGVAADYLQQHRLVNSFGELLTTFPRSWANQQRWLKEFFVDLPQKDRNIRFLGFRATVPQLADPDAFLDFLSRHEIRIIKVNNSRLRPALARLYPQLLKGEEDQPVRVDVAGLSKEIKTHNTTTEAFAEFGQAADCRIWQFDEDRAFVDVDDTTKQLQEFLEIPIGIENYQTPDARLQDLPISNLAEIVELVLNSN